MNNYTLNNNMKILIKNKKGVELKTWLDENRTKLDNQRIFYVLKANLEQGDIFKIGISEKGDKSAYSRLTDYFNHMGKTDKDNKCLGVRIYLLIANTFNPSVENNKVRAIETKMISHLKEQGATARGRERFKISINKLFETIDELGILKGDEDSNIIKRSARILESDVASADTVKNIIGYSKTKKGLLFEVSFYEYRKYDKNQNSKIVKQDNRTLSYKDLVGLRDGKLVADKYIKKHDINA